MAWPYSGAWAGKSAGNNELGTILASLCRAVNERRVAINLSTIIFFGTAYPSAATIAGNAINGVNVAAAIASIRSAITSMANSGDFYQTSAFTTPWTMLSLLADVGLGVGEEISILLANRCIRLRMCLDRLLYHQVECAYSWIESTATHGDDRDESEGEQAIWADRGANVGIHAEAGIEPTNVTWTPVTTGEVFPYQHLYQIVNSSHFLFATSTLNHLGTIVSAYITLSTYEQLLNVGFEFAVDVNGEVVITTSVTGDMVTELPLSTSLTVDTHVYVTIINTPSSVPIGLAYAGCSAIIEQTIKINVDLSPVLTDQA